MVLFVSGLVTSVPNAASAESFTKTWSKEDLAKTAEPVPVTDLSDILRDQIIGVASRVTANQNANTPKLLEFRNRSTDDPAPAYGLNVALLSPEVVDGRVDTDAMRTFLRSQTERAIAEEVKPRSAVYRMIRDGLAFNLRIGDLFTSESKSTQSAAELRYGLILKNITPVTTGSSQAAINDSYNEELRYAGKAEVAWTIGPVTEEQNRSIFRDVNLAGTAPTGSIWSRFPVPKPNFTGQIAPSSGDQSLPSVSSKGLGSGFKITLTQESGLYQMVLNTDNKFKKQNSSHEFRLPIVGKMSVGRKLDDKFDPVQTSAYNVLVAPQAPIVNLHYMHAEDRYRGELGLERGHRRVTAEALMRPGFRPGKGGLGKKGEEYKLNFSTSF